MTKQTKTESPQGNKTVRQPGLLRVSTISLLSVAVLFVGYEIVERTWLTGVAPEILHTLHILRGLSAAAIASALATLLLLRQMDDSPSKNALPPTPRPWKRRLQHVSLRTKIVVPMVGLAVAPALIVGFFAVSQGQQSLRDSVVKRVAFDTDSRARSIREFFHAVRQDLLFLSRTKAIRDLASAGANLPPERLALLRGEVEKELLIFSQGKRAYYQVRYVGADGREAVRLNVEDGLPWIVPVPQLQDKSDRYYVKDALTLQLGAIYVSPMDLNVEHGKVEIPYRGVVRYGTRVVGNDGNAQGILLINIYADFIHSLIGPMPPGVEAWLLADDGTYLGYVGESDERRNLFSLKEQRHVTADYSPEEVSILLSKGRDVQTLETARTLMSVVSIVPAEQSLKRPWRLLISHPRDPIEAPMRYLSVFVFVVTALIAAVAGLTGILVASYLARPVASLRRATREVASGNLGQRLEIATGDEIEELARDFSTMTNRLREAQERLSGWNAELEREVADQTDRLRQLQHGLARADKMAAIGQMTAGVMHEVGNPLAAIKTKIQVSEEEGNVCNDCRATLSEILREVDRLATFLHSFSRLSRLPEPDFKCLAITDVVRDVVVLITPVLRKRGVSLHVEPSAGVPPILGDANQMRHLLINLILNASEASPNGGQIVIRIRCVTMPVVEETSQPAAQSGTTGTCLVSADLPSGLAVEVVDQGTGMPPEVLEKIGNPFYTTKQDGTGLGLATCRQIVRDHKGAMWIESKARMGTTVRLLFPANDEDSLKQEAGNHSHPSRSPLRTDQ